MDNLFLNPENSRNGEKDADMPETHMCESCDEGHFGNFQFRMRAIITRSWFETALNYKPPILDLRIEELPLFSA